MTFNHQRKCSSPKVRNQHFCLYKTICL